MNDRFQLDFGFKCNYQIRASSPPTDEDFFVCSCSGITRQRQAGPNALFVNVEHQSGKSWCLAFEPGSGPDISQYEGIHPCPSPDHFLAVIGSTGFYIDATALKPIIMLSVFPVRKLEKSLNSGLLLVLDWQSITAISKDGVIWQTQDLVFDAIFVELILEDEIYGGGNLARDDFNEADYFRISSNDGSVISDVELYGPLF